MAAAIDVVRAGSGKDVINVRDRRGGDVVSCGSGRDTVVYERGDIVSRDCERRLRGADARAGTAHPGRTIPPCRP